MARQSVQDGYFEAPLAAFPGQIADFGTSNDNYVRGFPAAGAVIGGRGVVKGADIDLDVNANPLNQPAPYTVKAPVGGSVAADFVGIVIRTEAMTNVGDPAEAAYADKTMASVTHKQAGGALVYVKAPVAIAAGDTVFMSVDAAQAPNLPVGEFTNVTGAGVIALTNLQWYKSTAAGDVGIIEQL
tara:strand:- start:906 stop:1460 length:555 start_codon:yes stop_codon:yes gene_type:complete